MYHALATRQIVHSTATMGLPRRKGTVANRATRGAVLAGWPYPRSSSGWTRNQGFVIVLLTGMYAGLPHGVASLGGAVLRVRSCRAILLTTSS